MPKRAMHTDVLIAGAGPVGMALGADLSLRGVDILLADASDGKLEHPRVGTVGPRSMELFRRWGLAEPVRSAGWPADHSLDIAWMTALNGHEIYRIPFGTTASRQTPAFTPEPEQVCPQHWLNPLMSKHLAGLGTPVRYGWKVDEVTQHACGVTALITLPETGEVVTVEARYLAACDGAGSPIRKQLGVTAPERYEPQVFRNILFRAPQLRERLGDRDALVFFLASPKLLRYPLRSMDGVDLYRLTASGEDNSQLYGPEELVRDALGFDTPFEVLSDSDWLLTHQVAEAYRADHVFFVGDAAHTLSPSGGFGMNTGLGDAADLGWKLRAAVAGWAGPHLLDSYEAERKPVAELGLEQSQRNLKRTLRRVLPPEIAEDSETGRRIRAGMRRQFDEGGVRREFDAPDLHFGYRYDSGLIVADPAVEPEETWLTSALPGGRAPHAWIAPGRSTLDLFGTGFVLLSFEPARRATELTRVFSDRGIPLAIHTIHDNSIAELYGNRHTLVRPDGHVAWRGTDLPADVDTLADTVRGAR
jgi:2-polyprenyl-6-methoxyphenol hydroxylase-like FAD-dependent oxidoreductase